MKQFAEQKRAESASGIEPGIAPGAIRGVRRQGNEVPNG